MANNINPQGQFNPYVSGAQAQMPYTGAQVQPQPMVQQYFIPQNQTASYTTQQGLTIIPMNNDNLVDTYPVSPGNTVAFVNFNTNRMCFKSTNVNGIYMPPRWGTIVYDEQENQPQQQVQQTQNQPTQNQNEQNLVTREEFDELKSMLSEALSNSQSQAVNNQHYEQRQNSRYNGKRGNRNDEPRSTPTNNG